MNSRKKDKWKSAARTKTLGYSMRIEHIIRATDCESGKTFQKLLLLSLRVYVAFKRTHSHALGITTPPRKKLVAIETTGAPLSVVTLWPSNPQGVYRVSLTARFTHISITAIVCIMRTCMWECVTFYVQCATEIIPRIIVRGISGTYFYRTLYMRTCVYVCMYVHEC